jgi:plasmid stability protein
MLQYDLTRVKRSTLGETRSWCGSRTTRPPWQDVVVSLWFHYRTVLEECEMKSLTIKGVPEVLLRKLKARAKANRRSLNGEVIASLEYLVRHNRTAEELLAMVDAVRKSTRLPYLTDEMLNAWKREGRE